jgi:hypothetical protein
MGSAPARSSSLAWPSGRRPLGHRDPTAVVGDEQTRIRAFNGAYREIESRIKLLVSLPIASLDGLALRAELHRLE